MSATDTDDPVLVRFRRPLDEVYGDKIERGVLFGLRARGDVHPPSDYDIAVFLTVRDSFNVEATQLAAIETDILL
jgi:predicted nucleotidyltransferase